LRYLSAYTHRVAISNHRLVALEDGNVTFRWRDSAHGNKKKLMTLPVGVDRRWRIQDESLPIEFGSNEGGRAKTTSSVSNSIEESGATRLVRILSSASPRLATSTSARCWSSAPTTFWNETGRTVICLDLHGHLGDLLNHRAKRLDQTRRRCGHAALREAQR